MGLEEVQAAYDVALRCLLSDLALATSLATQIGVDFTDPDELQYTFVGPDHSHQAILALVEDLEAATFQLAEPLQDDVIDMLWRAWPDCPAHGHPAEPALLDGLAVWHCPTTELIVARIGSLGA